MSKNTKKVVFVLRWTPAQVAKLRESGDIEVTTFTPDRRAEVFDALRAFGVLSAFYRVGEQGLLDSLHRLWHIPTAPAPEWPLMHSGPDPIELPEPTLDNPGDAIMLITPETVEFYTRTGTLAGTCS